MATFAKTGMEDWNWMENYCEQLVQNTIIVF